MLHRLYKYAIKSYFCVILSKIAFYSGEKDDDSTSESTSLLLRHPTEIQKFTVSFIILGLLYSLFTQPKSDGFEYRMTELSATSHRVICCATGNGAYLFH